MPPAFVLSQDQTLRKINLFYRKIRFKALKLCCFDYIFFKMSQIEFSRLHRTIQFSISCCFFAASHNISLNLTLVKRILKIFWVFYQLRFLSHQGEFERCLIYHRIFFCQVTFWRFLWFFYQLALISGLTPKSKAFHNISQLSNFVKWHFENFMNFSYQPFLQHLDRTRSAKRHLIYHRISVCQIVFQNFFRFFISFISLARPFGRRSQNRDII